MNAHVQVLFDRTIDCALEEAFKARFGNGGENFSWFGNEEHYDMSKAEGAGVALYRDAVDFDFGMMLEPTHRAPFEWAVDSHGIVSIRFDGEPEAINA